MNRAIQDDLPGTQPTNVRYHVLAWVCSLSMLTYIDRVCFKEVEGDIRGALGLTEQQFSWAFSAFGLAYAIFEVPSGWLGDLFGPRQVLIRIVLWWSLFTALTGCVWNWGSQPLTGLLILVLIRFLFGMGEAGAYPNIARAMRNWFPFRRRGMAQGLLWMFGRWGGALSPWLILFLSSWFGWRGAFWALGIVGVIWVLAFACTFRDRPEEHAGVNQAEQNLIRDQPGGAIQNGDAGPKLSWKSLLRSRTLWCLCLMYFCSNAGWCFFITWDRKYYQTVLQLSDLALAVASGAPLFFGGVACLCGGFLTDKLVTVLGRRWGRTLQGLISYFLGGTFFLLALLTDNPWLAVPSLCIASFLKDFAMAASWSTCIDIGHRYSGTVAGFMNMVGNLGTFVSPPIVAHLARHGQWELALVYSACMFFVASAAWGFINPKRVIVYTAEDRR